MKKIIVSISLLTLLINFGCNAEHEEEHGKHGQFLVTNPLKKDTTVIKEYVCQIHSIQHIELRALEKGYLQNIYVDEGQSVKKGQLMFQIMPMLYQAELKKAEAEAEFAKIEYLNTKSLADSNIVSANELALAKAKYDKAIAEVDLANVHLSFTEIRAPFNGIMDKFHVRLGSLLDEGELMTELSDNSNVWVYFNVPEAEYLNHIIKMKDDSAHQQKVNLVMANNMLFDHVGFIETIEADFNNETGNIAFRATFPNPDGILRHGETGNIQIPQTIKEAIIIPQKATFEVLDKKYVYVIDQNNRLKPRKIVVDKELPHIYIIKEGLTTKDKILLDGLRKVKSGDKIAYKVVDAKSALTHLNLYAE